MKETSK